MSRALLWGSCAAVTLVVAGWWVQGRLTEPPALFEPPIRQIEAAPLCPWREPEADLRDFFLEGATYVTETRILSGLRVELTQHLGRIPEPEENALTLHRVVRGTEKLGAVITRRVKGEHGAIELALAINSRDEVLGLRLQRLREPASVASQVQNPVWLAAFRGRTHNRGWESDDISGLPEEARGSALAIREGVRSLLVLHAAAEATYSASRDHYQKQ